MKAIICSDLHGNYQVWQEVVSYLNPDDLLIIAGDLFGDRYPEPYNHHYQPELINPDKLSNQVKIVHGNCDRQLINPYLLFAAFNKKIFLSHGDQEIPYHLRNNFDIYICGHSHLPKLEKYPNYYLINPGSAAKPRGPYRTIALLEESKVSIYDLDRKITLETMTF